MALVAVYKLVTVAAAGSPIAIGAPANITYPVVSAWIQATSHNIYVGDKNISGTGLYLASASHDKIQLTADAQHALDLNEIYIDSDTNGGTATVVYMQKV